MAGTLDVFFATNRNLIDGDTPVTFGETFHADGSECYRVGKATVKSDRGKYTLSTIDVASETAPSDGDDAEAVLGSTAVFREIKRRMQEGNRDLVVLLHGYGADFKTAPERGAELAEKYLVLGKDGKERSPVVMVFSWPANGRTIPFKSYVSDRSDAAKSGRAIARLFLRLCGFLLNEARDMNRATDDESRLGYAPCPNRIHLVAHSMGNWALRNAVQAIVELRGADRLPSIFDNIFLMAADEDDDALQEPKKLAPLARLGNAVHVYHSKDDRALTISDVTKLNPDRLGANGPITMTALDEKVIAVDCRHVDDTKFAHARHQYYRLRKEVIGDVRQVLAGRTPGEIDGRKRLDHPNRFIIAQKEKKRR